MYLIRVRLYNSLHAKSKQGGIIFCSLGKKLRTLKYFYQVVDRNNVMW